MSKLVRFATLQEILNYGISIEDGELYHQDIIFDDIYRCELCNSNFKSGIDTLEHIINYHMDEELPEEYVVTDDSKYYDKPVQTEEIIDPYELEIH
jgi:hypothetical protein